MITNVKKNKLNIICKNCKNSKTKQLCICSKVYNNHIPHIIIIQRFFRNCIIKYYNADYYICSMKFCEYQINNTKNKALKDVVGYFYEKHIRRIYQYYTTFLQCKNNKIIKNYLGFTPDSCIIDKFENIKLISEIKGHYLDSCFLERALVGIVKTIQNFIDYNNIHNIPIFEIHSFTTYSLFNKKLNEFMKIIHPQLCNIVKDKLVYTSLCYSDRLHKNKWFTRECNRNCYSNFTHYYNIIKHIKFLQSIE